MHPNQSMLSMYNLAFEVQAIAKLQQRNIRVSNYNREIFEYQLIGHMVQQAKHWLHVEKCCLTQQLVGLMSHPGLGRRAEHGGLMVQAKPNTWYLARQGWWRPIPWAKSRLGSLMIILACLWFIVSLYREAYLMPKRGGNLICNPKPNGPLTPPIWPMWPSWLPMTSNKLMKPISTTH